MPCSEGDMKAEAKAAAMAAPAQIDVRMDMVALHCHACRRPLKRVFKCEAAGHFVCCFCRAGHAAICSRADAHCHELDAVVDAVKVPCPYKAFGCERYLAYHGAADHQRACHCAPCSCPEPGCGFVGSRAMLLDHLAAVHQRPAVTVRYCRPCSLSFSLSRRWHALVGEEDRSVFVVSLGALHAVTAVSLVCVRPEPDGKDAPRFSCKLSVERPGDDGDSLGLLVYAVRSSTLTTGAPAPGQRMYLAVPQELLSGDMLTLRVRIDQVRPATAAAAAATPNVSLPDMQAPAEDIPDKEGQGDNFSRRPRTRRAAHVNTRYMGTDWVNYAEEDAVATTSE